jgi:hypothetical protein
MSIIKSAGFLGANKALHPLLLPDSVGVESTNQKPGRGDLRPWKAPLTVATVPAGRKTIYRMGRDVAQDENYWLSWTTEVHAVLGPNAAEDDERTYFTGSGGPKWTDKSKAISSTSNAMPTAARDLGVPAPATPCLLNAEDAAPDVDLGKYTYKVTPAEVAALAVGDVVRFTFGDNTTQQITLTAGEGGVVTLASLQAQVDALAGLSASVVSAAAYVPPVEATDTTPFVPAVPAVSSGLRIVSDVIGVYFKIGKKIGVNESFHPDDVSYSTAFWAEAPVGLTAIAEVAGIIPKRNLVWASGYNINYSFASALGVLYANRPGVKGVGSAPGVPAAAATAIYDWENINATLTPVGMKLAVTVNGTQPVLVELGAGPGTFPPAVTLDVMVKAFSAVDGLKAEKVLDSNGVNYNLKLSTHATGESARFDIKQVLPEVSDVFITVATAVEVKTLSGAIESRYYTYTYVTDVGEESAPTAPSLELSCSSSSTVTVLSFAAPPAGNYGINRIRIYRTQSGTGGNADFYFVREIAATLTTTTDDGRPIAEPLPSTAWLTPPEDLHSLTGLWNGMMAGISGRSVRFCEAFVPYAWPFAYEVLPTNTTPVALATFGQTLVMLTDGNPSIITGGTPDAMDEQPMEWSQACVAPLSAVGMGHGVAWAAPDGLAYVGNGGPRLLTDGILTRDDWQALKPETITGTMYEGRYFGFYNDGTRKAFMLDPANPQGMYFMDFGVDAVYLDRLQDALYVLDGVNVKKWDAGAALTVTVRTKVHRMPKPVPGFACAEVVADSYPVSFKLYADGALKHTQSVASSAPFRLPGGYHADRFQVELSTTGAIQGYALAHAMQELAQT